MKTIMANEALRELTEQFGDNDALLTSTEAAKYLRRSPVTLERWRRLGIGPEYVRVSGRPLYPLRALRRVHGEVA